MESNVDVVALNPEQLDIEAVCQAELFLEWAEKSVEAKAEADRLKRELDTEEALTSLRIREKPEDFGLERVTEGAIVSAVKTNKAYLKALEAYQEARKTSALYDQVVNALEQRKRMIEVLVTLHGQQYFAGPSVPRDLVAEWKEHQEARSEKVTSRQKSVARKRGK